MALRALVPCAVAFLLTGCTEFFLGEEEEKCGAKDKAVKDYTLADAEAGFEKRSWDLKLEDVCGREHHRAEFTMDLRYPDSDCDPDKVVVTGDAYTAFGLEPYQANVTRSESSDDDFDTVSGSIQDIGYGQQADTSGAKPLLVVVEAVYAHDEGPEKADRCLMEIVDGVHIEVSYSHPKAAAPA